ncbi:MAG: flagellar basal-body rod protein FlgG [Selenomonadaceae bacterium]|nr:flagellar basal-body rod protein FlgG [Selenomonadaceae bacterium]
MMRALWSAASGMKAQQVHMDVLSNNIANVNTYGGKKVRTEFQDLIYQTVREAGANSGADSQYPTAMQIGLGTRHAATNRIFTQGPLQTTDNPTDIGIQGEGFFRITLPDGTTAYTRDGSFKLDSQRRMVTTDGYPLADDITIDETAPSDSITISGDGRVSYTPAGGTQQEAGQIMLARFVNPAGLTSIGKNLFIVSEASGEAIEGNPGEEGAGTLTQGTLEMSNVLIVEEMVEMIISQRAYESNSKAITTSDSMLEIANGLKR